MNRTYYYNGQGQQQDEPKLPSPDREQLRKPENYLASSELRAAVQAALTLGMPLLLSGEPGSGKSRLAHSIAWELQFGEPLEFVVKSDTQGQDLFYRYDTVGRFHAANTKGVDADPRAFITFEPLGQALLRAKPSDFAYHELLLDDCTELKGYRDEQRRSVVLIDEIDKAPRDVPNDLLVEIETMSFSIPELPSSGGGRVQVALDRHKAENDYRPIVIITSNSEKALPEAFLRRCVFYHLPFPKFADEDDAAPGAVTIEEIVWSHLGGRHAGSDRPLVDGALAVFRCLRRANGIARKPSLAELLDWLNYLLNEVPREQRAAGLADLDRQMLAESVAHLLLKQPADQQRVNELLQPCLDAITSGSERGSV